MTALLLLLTLSYPPARPPQAAPGGVTWADARAHALKGGDVDVVAWAPRLAGPCRLEIEYTVGKWSSLGPVEPDGMSWWPVSRQALREGWVRAWGRMRVVRDVPGGREVPGAWVRIQLLGRD